LKVHIEENLYIESDEYQFILKEYTSKVDKHGRELYKTHGYFSKLEHVLHKLVRMKIKESNATTLKELLKEIKELKEYFKDKIDF